MHSSEHVSGAHIAEGQEAVASVYAEIGVLQEKIKAMHAAKESVSGEKSIAVKGGVGIMELAKLFSDDWLEFIEEAENVLGEEEAQQVERLIELLLSDKLTDPGRLELAELKLLFVAKKSSPTSH